MPYCSPTPLHIKYLSRSVGVKSAMHHSAAPVPAFYEPEGPPKPLPLLTYHTEMFCPTSSHLSISPHEEMAFSTLTLRGRPRVSRDFATMSSRSITHMRSRSPTPKVSKSVSFSAEQIPQKNDPENMSTYSSLSSMQSGELKIPKPEGEAGRPGRGGYNLETALHWDASRFKKFKVRSNIMLLRRSSSYSSHQEHVHRSIEKHCDASRSKTHQDCVALDSVQKEVILPFPQFSAANLLLRPYLTFQN